MKSGKDVDDVFGETKCPLSGMPGCCSKGGGEEGEPLGHASNKVHATGQKKDGNKHGRA